MKLANSLLIIGIVSLWCGCATLNEAWMKSYVAVHDAADAALASKTNQPPAVVTPPAANPATVTPASSTIKYSEGAKGSEYGEEIWIANWHRMNIRIHANPGEFRSEGVPSVGPWYPIMASVIPDGTITLEKTADGCTLAARDFISTGGQAYHIEGWRCDGIGSSMVRGGVVKLTTGQMYGACFAWYATIEK